MESHEAVWAERISEYLDGALPATAAADTARHLETCDACRRLADEFTAIKTRAHALGPRPPTSDLWQTIRVRLGEAEVVPFPVAEEPSGSGVVLRATRGARAAAVAALVLVAGGSGWGLRTLVSERHDSRPLASGPTAAAPATVPAATVDAAPAGPGVPNLAGVLRDPSLDVDANTRRLLENSLALIERAIRESSAALEIDPGNAYVAAHLQAARERRSEFLRDAAILLGTEP